LWDRWLNRAARLLLCKLAWTPSRLGRFLVCKVLLVWAVGGEPCLLTGGGGSGALLGAMIPVHLLICFWRYFLWLTFLFDFTGLSNASLMLLEAESIKLSRSLVVSLILPSSRLFSTSYSITEPGKQKFKNCGFMIAACTAITLLGPEATPVAPQCDRLHSQASGNFSLQGLNSPYSSGRQ
uniref:Uncharacterized protein n=1 Tax=Neogobius melanostomus TaxID=47308 RepID=A0A8C6TJS5_9GOBI